MDVQILGVGGYTDQVLLRSIKMAAMELGIAVEIKNVQDIDLFVKKNIKAIPALIIDNHLVSYGRVPCVSELKNYLNQSNFVLKENRS